MSDAHSLNDDFVDYLCALADEGVEFLIVGAYAVAFHGVPRATGHLDVLVRPTPENAERVFRAMARFGAPLDAVGVAREDLARPGMVCQVGIPPRRIDTLTEITGMDFDRAWASRIPASVRGRTVFFIGREALLENKRATGRSKDLADVERLEGKGEEAGHSD